MASINPESETSAGESRREFECSSTFTKSGFEKKCESPETKVPGKCRKVLVRIKEKLLLMKKTVEDRWAQLQLQLQLQHSCGPGSERTKIYQIWPGKNVPVLYYYYFLVLT